MQICPSSQKRKGVVAKHTRTEDQRPLQPKDEDKEAQYEESSEEGQVVAGEEGEEQCYDEEQHELEGAQRGMKRSPAKRKRQTRATGNNMIPKKSSNMNNRMKEPYAEPWGHASLRHDVEGWQEDAEYVSLMRVHKEEEDEANKEYIFA